jgi:YD repeat-containing protein
LIRSVDPTGEDITSWTYDSFGNQTSQSLPDPPAPHGDAPPASTTYTFDADHHVLSQTDPDGNTSFWSYDFDGWTTAEKITVPDGGGSTTATQTFTRDADGNVTALVDYDGRLTTYRYNCLNEETWETWSADSDGSGTYHSIGYTYDERGALTGAVDSGGGTPMYVDRFASYNLPGNVSGETQQIDGRATVVVSQSWNFDGTRASLSVNIGGTLNADGTASGGTPDFQNAFGHDKLGRMTSVAQTGDSVAPKYASIGYDLDGQLTSVDTYAADSGADPNYQVMHEAIAYDADLQPIDLRYTTVSGGGILAGYHYINSLGRVSGFLSYNDTLDVVDRTADYQTWADAYRRGGLRQTGRGNRLPVPSPSKRGGGFN